MSVVKMREGRQDATERTAREPKWQCPGPIQDDIVYYATTTKWTPAQIHDEVKDSLTRKKSKLIMTSKRTVERMVLFYRTHRLLEPWSVADSQPEDAALILEVLADVILSVEQKHTFSKREAEWVLMIRKILQKMLPKVERFTVWEIARAYLIAETRGRDTGDLDAYLAFNPWKNKNRFENYKYALERRWVEDAPSVVSEQDWRSGKNLDQDPSLRSLRLQVEDMERTGPSKPEQARKRHNIERQNPELAEKMLKAWEDGYQRQKQLWFEWRRQGKTKLTPKDRAAWLSVWDEYNRLADSHNECEDKKQRTKKKGESNGQRSLLGDYSTL